MAVPFTRLESQAIENYGERDLYDNLLRYDGIIAGLGGREAIKYEVGGRTEFRERTLYGQNTNVGHRGKNAQIPTVDDEGFTMAATPQRVISGSIVYNQVELDQCQGDEQLGDLIEDKIAQFNATWVQVIADALRQSAPSATEPYTLLPSGTSGTVNGILVAAAPASQAGITTAGISRNNTWWRNQFSSTSFDLTTVAGQRGLYLNVYAPCTRGNGPTFEPDIAPCSTVVLASLGADADNNRRATYSDGRLKVQLGHDSIMFFNAALIRDSSSQFLNGSAGLVTFLNSRALRLKVLRGRGTTSQQLLTQRNNLKGLPINWKTSSFHPDYDSLNFVRIGYLVYNLVPKSLQDHGLANNCT